MNNVFRIELNLLGIFVSALIIWLFYNQIKEKNQENRIFLLLVILTIVELVLDTIFWIVDRKVFAYAVELNHIVNFFYYFFQIVECYVCMVYYEIYLNRKKRGIAQCCLMLPLIIGVLLMIFNIWTGTVFTIDEVNIYEREWGVGGSLETICCLFYPSYCLVLSVREMFAKQAEKRRGGRYLLLVSSVPIISALIQIIFYGLNFIWVGMAIALLVVFVGIETRQYQEMQRELIDQRIKIMLSQIQPHFLYNSLASISHLCDEDPQKAKEATNTFSRYLRKNMDSLKLTHPVAFETELQHVKAYLTLEKVRFEDALHIIYNIETVEFLVPALTVQPLVENAVKYGVCQKEDGGTIRIDTKEGEDCFQIIIADDGVGFDPYQTQYDGRSHIGIDNVKNRLKAMCDGSLAIKSEAGKGTTVVISIPKGEE